MAEKMNKWITEKIEAFKTLWDTDVELEIVGAFSDVGGETVFFDADWVPATWDGEFFTADVDGIKERMLPLTQSITRLGVRVIATKKDPIRDYEPIAGIVLNPYDKELWALR